MRSALETPTPLPPTPYTHVVTSSSMTHLGARDAARPDAARPAQPANTRPWMADTTTPRFDPTHCTRPDCCDLSCVWPNQPTDPLVWEGDNA